MGAGVVVNPGIRSSCPVPDAPCEERVARSADVVLHDVSLAYRNGLAVSGLSGCFAQGSLTAIVGPNGAGKTTLLKAMLGLIRPVGGRIDRPWTPRAMAYLSQGNEVDREFPITVADFVAVGLWSRIGSLRAVNGPLKCCIEEALAVVGLAGSGSAWISDLSGGQFQRVRFARLLVQDAPALLLDEPFAGIDSRTVDDLLVLVARWHGGGKTVIAVLHDLDLVRRHFPRTLVLSGRGLAWDETAASLAVLEALGRSDAARSPSRGRSP